MQTPAAAAGTSTIGDVTSLGQLCDEPSESCLLNFAAGLNEKSLLPLGINLGLTTLEIKEIKQDNVNKLQRFMDLFVMWKAKGKAPYTWKTFVERLELPSVDEKAVAAEIREKL